MALRTSTGHCTGIFAGAGFLSPVILAVLLVVSLTPAVRAQQPLIARALVEKQEVFQGEPFLFQISVEGSESPDKPELRALDGFNVQEMGGQQNSSQSVTIVNGRIDRVVRKGYVFAYRLTPARLGTLTIPAIKVSAEGRTATTVPVSVRVVPPRESDEVKLRVSLSEAKAYVGQPVTMTVTWYVSGNVRDYAMNLPVLDDSRFDVIHPSIQPDPNRHVQIPLQSGQTIGEKGESELDGQRYLTVTIRKVLVPRQPGTISLPQATVSCEILRGYRRSSGSVLDDFLGSDFPSIAPFGRQAVYERAFAPSNQPTITVLPLPEAGRPANFSGLVGRYEISATATPTEVRVGDPITLTLDITGRGYLGNVELPDLARQTTLANDFKMPPDRASGTVTGQTKRFTQTIRATHPGVSQVPPIELAFFDPDKGAYEIARTSPIPLGVQGTRIVTARDAEGMSAAAPVQAEIESREGGISYNYDGPDVLIDQALGPAAWLRSPAWLAGLAIPPLLYFGLLAFLSLRRWKEADPSGRKARAAFGRFSKEIRRMRPADSDEFYSALLDALRRYLGARLGLPAGALTFADVRGRLEPFSVPEETITALRSVFDRCEAGRYARAAYGGGDAESFARTVVETAQRLEQSLK